MKKLLLTLIALTTLNANISEKTSNLPKECEKMIEKSAEVHWLYVEGKVSLNKDYNTLKKAKKVCKKYGIKLS